MCWWRDSSCKKKKEKIPGVNRTSAEFVWSSMAGRQSHDSKNARKIQEKRARNRSFLTLFTFPSLSYRTTRMFKKTSRSRNIRRKIEVTEDEPTEIEQGTIHTVLMLIL